MGIEVVIKGKYILLLKNSSLPINWNSTWSLHNVFSGTDMKENIQFNLIYNWQKIKPIAYGRFNLLLFYSAKLQKKKIFFHSLLRTRAIIFLRKSMILFTLKWLIYCFTHNCYSNICYKHRSICNQKMQRIAILKRHLSYLNSFQPERMKKEILTRYSLFFSFLTTQSMLCLSEEIVWSHHMMRWLHLAEMKEK